MNILCIMTAYYVIKSLNNINILSSKIEQKTNNNLIMKALPDANIHILTNNMDEELRKFLNNPFVVASFLHL